MTNSSSSQSNYEKLAVSPLEVVDLLAKSNLTQSVNTSHWTSAILKALQFLKVSPEVEFSDGPDFKSVMIKNGIRFRLIEPEEIESEEGLNNWIKETAETIYHPVGTCKMGIDSMSVVDPKLKVIGTENLRVADASIMPTLVGGNTNAPAMMIGEKASNLILEEN